MEKDRGLSSSASPPVGRVQDAPLDQTNKSRWERSWPTIAAGAGLFSDGYLNGVCLDPVFGDTHHALLLIWST